MANLAMATLRRMKDAGFHLSVDDFGTDIRAWLI